jgi:hypothetical protein
MSRNVQTLSAIDEWSLATHALGAIGALLHPEQSIDLDGRQSLALLFEELLNAHPPEVKSSAKAIASHMAAVRDLLCADMPIDLVGRRRIADLVTTVAKRHARACAEFDNQTHARSIAESATHPKGEDHGQADRHSA